MNRRQVLFAGAVAAALPLVPRAIAEIAPLTIDGGLAFAQVVAGGAGPPLLFLVDTGAAVTVMDGSMAQTLGLDRFLPKSGPVRASPTGISTAGKTALVEPVLADLSSISAVLGRPVKGLLGSDFLSRFHVRLDFADKTLALEDTKLVKGPNAIALRFDDLAFIRAVVLRDGRSLEGEFGVDTGLDSFVKLYAPRAATAFPGLQTVPGKTESISGGKTQEIAPIESMTVGGLNIPAAAAIVSNDPPPRGSGPDFAGMIGAHAFVHRILTLDVRGGWASVSPVIL